MKEISIKKFPFRTAVATLFLVNALCVWEMSCQSAKELDEDDLPLSEYFPPDTHLLSGSPCNTTGNLADQVHYTITGQNSVTFDWCRQGTSSDNSIQYGVTAAYGQTVNGQNPLSPCIPFSS